MDFSKGKRLLRSRLRILKMWEQLLLNQFPQGLIPYFSWKRPAVIIQKNFLAKGWCVLFRDSWTLTGVGHKQLSGNPVPVFDHSFFKTCFLKKKNHSHATFSWTPGRKAQHLLVSFPSSKSCREQWGHPQLPFLQTRQARWFGCLGFFGAE